MRNTGQTEGKRRSGNAGGRPSRPASQRQGVPNVPAGLDKAGQLAWVELWQAGHWLNVDKHSHAMTIVCRNFDELAVYQAEARKHPFVRGSMGQRRVNPAVSEIRKLEASIRSWLKELGFFVHQEGGSEPNDLDRFLAGGLPS